MRSYSVCTAGGICRAPAACPCAATRSLLQSARLVEPVMLLTEPAGHAWHGGRATVLLPPEDHVLFAQVVHHVPPVPGGQIAAELGEFVHAVAGVTHGKVRVGRMRLQAGSPLPSAPPNQTCVNDAALALCEPLKRAVKTNMSHAVCCRPSKVAFVAMCLVTMRGFWACLLDGSSRSDSARRASEACALWHRERPPCQGCAIQRRRAVPHPGRTSQTVLPPSRAQWSCRSHYCIGR